MNSEELYEPTEVDWQALSIIQFREPIETFMELVCNSYHKGQAEWVDEMRFIMEQVLDDMTTKRFGRAKA